VIRIISGEGTGKTKQIIQLAVEQNAVVVCEDVNRMLEKEHAYGITGVDFISYHDFLNDPPVGRKIFVDDLDKFAYHLGISGYTLSTN